LEKIKLTKKIIIHGDFEGKYHGNEIYTKSSFSDYDIKINNCNVKNAVKKEYLEAISEKSISFKTSKLENVKIQLNDENYDSKYVFLEDLEDVLIYDIRFSNVINEGYSTYGEITGKIYGSLVYEEEVELAKLPPEPPKKTSEILKNVAFNFKEKAERNFFPSLSILFYIFLFLCLAFLLEENLIIILLFAAGIYILRSILIFLINILFKSSYLIFIILLSLGLWSIFSEGLDSSRNEDEITLEDPPEYNEIISRSISWNDYDEKRYYGDFKFKYGDYLKSKKNKEQLTPFSNRDLYSSLNRFDQNRLDMIYSTLQRIRNENNLSRNRFAEVVVSLIQSIPYSYNIENDCEGNNLPEAYKEAIKSGIPCLSFTRHDILSPLEFFYLKKGDCDSRTVLIYTILKRFGYDVAILNSNLYAHSMIGINLPTYGKYKLINGKKYYFWETTAQGWELGVLPPDNWDISKWYLALK
tara:strand:- start:5180 stop:6589 length:1410 start_codon:yes stop_codon:yes gene_type:complete